jgi:YHS domain-containing protein
MPVTAGITDTAHYEGKVIGFCATGCKEEFLKDPKASIAAAEMK